MNVRKKLPRAVEKFGKLCDTVRKKYEPRFLRHLLSALPFIVFAILGYCCILFAADHPKIFTQKVQSNQKQFILRSAAAKGAARAAWHGQAFQQWITAKSTLLIGSVLLPYSIPFAANALMLLS